MNSRLVAALCGPAVAMAACTSPHAPTVDCSPAAHVTRAECLRIAEAYRTHPWFATSGHAFHGLDRRGIRIDTPDVGYRPPDGQRPGWWVPDAVNTGIPYQWGGFDTPQSFDGALRDGRFAGDVYSDYKRRLLDAGTSQQCCGIDCSGFISRCWRLDRSYSTRELTELCERLSSFNELKPGDILNKPNEHVLLFVRFVDPAQTRFEAYEAGSPPSWKVLRHAIPVEYVRGLGYKPFRYRHMTDR